MQNNKNEGINLLVYLGIPLFIIGMVLFIKEAGNIKTWFVSKDWPGVQARIIDAKIIRTTGRNASSSLVGHFEYQYEGKKYESREINLAGGFGGTDRDKEQKNSELQKHKKNGTTIEALVNPANPSQAFIYRDLTLDTIAITVMGLFFMWLGYKISRKIFR